MTIIICKILFWVVEALLIAGYIFVIYVCYPDGATILGFGVLVLPMLSIINILTLGTFYLPHTNRW
jgi:hypothetical protein